ncbi:hypothetical protein PAMP_022818 [Pampus punctatissimus]
MRAHLLGQAAVFAALLALSTCLTGSHMCSRSLDCARMGRLFCKPGSSHCGPCLRPLVENSHGHCVFKRRHAAHSAQSSKGKMSMDPELDEEIDFLSAVISEQRTESRLPAPTSQDVSIPQSKQLSESSPTFRASTTEQSTNQSMSFTSTAPPTTTTNHTPALLKFSVRDHVFLRHLQICTASFPSDLLYVFLLSHEQRLHRGRFAGFDCSRGLLGQPGDKRLAHSAQMYHYQHQKQQMLSLEKHRDDPKVPESGASTDEENEDGDFTVYECPGLAPTGEMEVKNPLFDDSTLYLQRFHK